MNNNYGIPFSPYEAADLEVASSELYHGSLDKTSLTRVPPVMGNTAGPHKCPAPLCDERFQELHILQSMLNDLDKNLKDLRESKCVECSHARHSPSSSRSQCQSGKWCRTKSGFENVIGSVIGRVGRALSSKQRNARKDQVQQSTQDWPSPTHPVSTEQMWEDAYANNLQNDLGWRRELSGTGKSLASLRPELPGLDTSPLSYDFTVSRPERMHRPVIAIPPPRAELEVLRQPRAELESPFQNRNVHLPPTYSTTRIRSQTDVSIDSQYRPFKTSSFDAVSPWSSICTNSTSTSTSTAPSSLDSDFGQLTESPDAYGPSEKLPWDVRQDTSEQGSFLQDKAAAELPDTSVPLGMGASTSRWPRLPGSFGIPSLPDRDACTLNPTASSVPQETGKSNAHGLQDHSSVLPISHAPLQSSNLLMAAPDHTAGMTWDETGIDYLNSFSQENTLLGGFEGLDPSWQTATQPMLPNVSLDYPHQNPWGMKDTVINPTLPVAESVKQPDLSQVPANTFTAEDVIIQSPEEAQSILERRGSVCCRPCRFYPDDGPDQRKKIAKHKLTARHRKVTGQGHDMAESFQCQTCKKIYNRRDNLIQHAKLHSAVNTGVRIEGAGISLPRDGASLGLQRRVAKRRPPSDVRRHR